MRRLLAVLSTPDRLKWVEPPTFPGARLAIVHSTFVNPADDPRKK